MSPTAMFINTRTISLKRSRNGCLSGSARYLNLHPNAVVDYRKDQKFKEVRDVQCKKMLGTFPGLEEPAVDKSDRIMGTVHVVSRTMAFPRSQNAPSGFDVFNNKRLCIFIIFCWSFERQVLSNFKKVKKVYKKKTRIIPKNWYIMCPGDGGADRW